MTGEFGEVPFEGADGKPGEARRQESVRDPRRPETLQLEKERLEARLLAEVRSAR